MSETELLTKMLYNALLVVEQPVTIKALYNAYGGVPLVEARAMNIGRSVGFAVYRVSTGEWTQGDGKASCNHGFAVGFYVWSTEYGRFMKGGNPI